MRQVESINEVIHKKKEAKKKQEAKGQLSVDLLDYRTIGKNSTKDLKHKPSNAQHLTDQKDERQASAQRTRNQIINQEIDEFLYLLINEGLIDVQYMAYYAKACHIIGITIVNQLAINARNGEQPQRLFAYKVKGALSLHYKREFTAINIRED